MSFSRINWDALGVTTSVVCAIHCAVLPLAVATLPILGVNIIHNAGFEYGMIGLALVIGLRALWHGFRRHHQRLLPLLLFATGMIFLIAKQIWHNYELALLPLAVTGIISAHVLNYRFSRVPGI
ncbi:MAG TPA: MerC domain-containing protein [Puia sp.]|jgi:hypothetical protein|nr:MerC domain-containing protein [Puia sp.]